LNTTARQDAVNALIGVMLNDKGKGGMLLYNRTVAFAIVRLCGKAERIAAILIAERRA
jgi:hypothetical protein